MLLGPDKEHKKVFPNISLVAFCNGKSLKNYLVRAVLHKTSETGRCKPCQTKTCLVCNSIRTTTTFKIRSGHLNCNAEKVLYLLKCKAFTEAPYVGKNKTKFRCRFQL